MENDISPDYISPIELSKRSGADLNNIYIKIYSGKLPARKINGRWKIAEDDADDFCEHRRRYFQQDDDE